MYFMEFVIVGSSILLLGDGEPIWVHGVHVGIDSGWFLAIHIGFSSRSLELECLVR